MQHFTAQHTGQQRKVLFEDQNKNGMMEGYTDNYIKYLSLTKKNGGMKLLIGKFNLLFLVV